MKKYDDGFGPYHTGPIRPFYTVDLRERKEFIHKETICADSGVYVSIGTDNKSRPVALACLYELSFMIYGNENLHHVASSLKSHQSVQRFCNEAIFCISLNYNYLKELAEVLRNEGFKEGEISFKNKINNLLKE